MSRIGSVIASKQIDWDRAEEHGSFVVFGHGEGDEAFDLRCVVWRDSGTREIIGHDFAYTRVVSRDWCTAHEAVSPQDCLVAIPPEWRVKAEDAVNQFLEIDYPALLDGTLPLTEIREDTCAQLGLLASLLGGKTFPPSL